MFKRLDLTVSCSGLQLVSAITFLAGKSKEWIKEHKASLFESAILFLTAVSDCTASDKVKLNSGVPAEHCTSITTQVESEFKNSHFSTTSVGF